MAPTMVIDLEKAKGQLDLLNDDNDDRVKLALDAATVAIFNHWEVPMSDYIDGSSGALEVPVDVGQAILLATRSLFYDPAVDPLTAAVRSLMVYRRTPSIA